MSGKVTRALFALRVVGMVFIVLVALILLMWHYPLRNIPEPSAEELTHAIKLAGDYLTSIVDDDGRFVYVDHPDSSYTLLRDYNILRHAGTIYSMAQAWSVTPNPSLKTATLRAATFLKERAIHEVPNHDSLLAVWSNQEDHPGRMLSYAKLGGTGLTLLALSEVEKIESGFTSLDTLQMLAHFVCFMQKEDGSFYSRYLVHRDGRDDEWTSLYYPGEAALGLLRLHALDGDTTWSASARRALLYLTRERWGKMVVPADHWALLATADILTKEELQLHSGVSDSLEAHAAQIIKSILIQSWRFQPDKRLAGCLYLDGRTTPTATRSEGLHAIFPVLSDRYKPLRGFVGDLNEETISFLVRSQIDSGRFAGAIPRAIVPQRPLSLFWDEGYRRSAQEVRIDYVQHALSAMVMHVTSLRSNALDD